MSESGDVMAEQILIKPVIVVAVAAVQHLQQPRNLLLTTTTTATTVQSKSTTKVLTTELVAMQFPSTAAAGAWPSPLQWPPGHSQWPSMLGCPSAVPCTLPLQDTSPHLASDP